MFISLLRAHFNHAHSQHQANVGLTRWLRGGVKKKQMNTKANGQKEGALALVSTEAETGRLFLA